MHTKIITGLTTAVTVAAMATPALAQTPAPTPQPAATGPSVHINACKVAHSRNGFTWASCAIVTNGLPAGTSAALQYHANLKTFKPRTNGTWSAQSGRLTLSGIQNIKMAFPGKSVAQVQKSLKVTLSTSTPGVTVTQAVASAAQGA